MCENLSAGIFRKGNKTLHAHIYTHTHTHTDSLTFDAVLLPLLSLLSLSLLRFLLLLFNSSLPDTGVEESFSVRDQRGWED